MVARARRRYRARHRDLDRHAEALRRGGPYLLGAFSLADAFYAPVAFRFRTYGVAAEGVAADYLDALLAHPLLLEWEAAALAETAIVEADEPRVIYREKLARPMSGERLGPT